VGGITSRQKAGIAMTENNKTATAVCKNLFFMFVPPFALQIFPPLFHNLRPLHEFFKHLIFP
jgi:hypothetical protein